MIPLLHDFTGSTVLIFGGGPVGARKARRFAHEARVVVVSPTFADADFGGAECVRAAPVPEDIPIWFEWVGPALVVAATSEKSLNDAVAKTAHERGVLLNRADRSTVNDGETNGSDARSVVVPATVRDDPVLMAIATGGRSPALSRYLRERFEEEFANAGAMANLSGTLRAQLREELPPEKRQAAIREVVRSERVWKALGNSSLNAEQEAKLVLHDALSEGDES